MPDYQGFEVRMKQVNFRRKRRFSPSEGVAPDGQSSRPDLADSDLRMTPPLFDRIKFRVMLLALLPVLLLAVGLSLLLSTAQRADDGGVNRQLAEVSAKLIAAAATPALLAQQSESLAWQLEPLFLQSHALRLQLFDPQGERLLMLERELLDSPYQLTLVQAIRPPQHAVSEEPLGRLVIDFMAVAEPAPQRLFPPLAIPLALLGLLLTLGVAWWLARGLTLPLEAIILAVQRMKKGDFSTRVQVASRGELLSLERGFNAMARELENSRKRMKQKIDQATGDLTQTMEELEIKNVELDLARKRAIDASRVKSEFLANMSHEIRTPMHGVIGFTELLLKLELSQEQRQLVKNISTSARGLLGIINNILDYSKLEHEAQQPVNALFNVENCCDEAVAMLSPTAHDKGLELNLLFYADVPRMLIGDEVRIRQILVNLLSNAVKFTDQGEVVLRVMVEAEQGERCTLFFSISDTGIGIPPEEVQKLFRSFHQGDPSARRRFGGTGLGLSICRKLAELLGGEIGVSSEVGVGSLFYLSLPLGKPSHVDPLPPPPFAGHHARLLCSDRSTTLALSHRLQALGMEVTSNSVTYPLPSTSVSWDLVVIACSGAELRSGVAQQAVARWRSGQDLPVLALLSSSERATLEYFEELFGVTSATQPISLEALTHVLQRALGEEQDVVAGSAYPQYSGDSRFQGLRVLAVDDHPINLELITALLATRGVSVDAVASGREAIHAAKAGHYALIVMDVHMPEVSGIDATLQIREEEATERRTPIIALTADITPATRDRVAQAGMDGLLVKPLDEKKFWSLFASLLERDTAFAATVTQEILPETVPLAEEEGGGEAPAVAVAAAHDSKEVSVRDLEAALRITGGKRDLVERMFQQFMSELEEQWQQLEQLYAESNFQALGNSAHRLKGGASICALPEFIHAVEQLEQSAKAKEAEATSASMAALRLATQHLQQLL